MSKLECQWLRLCQCYALQQAQGASNFFAHMEDRAVNNERLASRRPFEASCRWVQWTWCGVMAWTVWTSKKVQLLKLEDDQVGHLAVLLSLWIVLRGSSTSMWGWRSGQTIHHLWIANMVYLCLYHFNHGLSVMGHYQIEIGLLCN
jgi:hypothetical protein